MSGPCSRLCETIDAAATGNGHGIRLVSLSLLLALLASVCSLDAAARQLRFSDVVVRAERLGQLLDVLLEFGAVAALLDARASLERVRAALSSAAESLLAEGVLVESDLVLGADAFETIIDLVEANAPPTSSGQASPLVAAVTADESVGPLQSSLVLGDVCQQDGKLGPMFAWVDEALGRRCLATAREQSFEWLEEKLAQSMLGGPASAAAELGLEGAELSSQLMSHLRDRMPPPELRIVHLSRSRLDLTSSHRSRVPRAHRIGCRLRMCVSCATIWIRYA